jgi:hypothetical protein
LVDEKGFGVGGDDEKKGICLGEKGGSAAAAAAAAAAAMTKLCDGWPTGGLDVCACPSMHEVVVTEPRRKMRRYRRSGLVIRNFNVKSSPAIRYVDVGDPACVIAVHAKSPASPSSHRRTEAGL